ncbi:multicopper oxidase family protein [Catelliglobosispora koreensis]|uniref:multicopper oxidase family protein n=1 Tax=Catelliglobosispora koreensis TaxID=129052 RepID=UPI0003694965|nr:multicopper oxidase domain-containing protein [Catelliglobosispora koreensis]
MTQPVVKRSPWKKILIVALVLLLICCGGAVAFVTWLLTGNKIDTFGKVDFANQLAIPALAPSQVDAQGRRIFNLTAQAGQHTFGSGRGGNGTTWGFNGDYLGPTLRAKAGEQVVVNVHNKLDETTTVHWHGMHLPAAMDGGPHQLVSAGKTWSPTWKIAQPASTLWYHPHLHGETADHVYKGLAGMFILDGDTPKGLPETYGVDDIPLIVQDKAFESNGKLDDRNPFLSGVGILGDEIVVNGTHSPFLDVTAERVRLRVLNASNARVFNFGFDDDRRFDVIGTDGGLLEKPVSMDRLQLSAGERAEIVVSMKPGERIVLRSYDPDLGSLFDDLKGGADQFDVLQLRAAASLKPSAALPATLTTIDRLSNPAVTRKFSLSGHSINGKQMQMNRIDFAPTVNTTEAWEVFNNDGDLHSFHVHDVQFQILAVNGAPPPPHLMGWKDTVLVASDMSYKLIMRFTDHADPNVPYMYHCHVLYHEDAGMMGQFVVVQPGQSPGTPPSHEDHSAHAGHH